MKKRRQTYYLNVTEAQMKELQSLVRQERQRIAAEGSKRAPRVVRLQGLQKALENSIYFFDKHNNKVNELPLSEENEWFSESV
ncbi:MAG: hypothetical protein ACKOKF_12585 [Bacteroidota bacterium]